MSRRLGARNKQNMSETAWYWLGEELNWRHPVVDGKKVPASSPGFTSYHVQITTG